MSISEINLTVKKLLDSLPELEVTLYHTLLKKYEDLKLINNAPAQLEESFKLLQEIQTYKIQSVKNQISFLQEKANESFINDPTFNIAFSLQFFILRLSEYSTLGIDTESIIKLARQLELEFEKGIKDFRGDDILAKKYFVPKIVEIKLKAESLLLEHVEKVFESNKLRFRQQLLHESTRTSQRAGQSVSQSESDRQSVSQSDSQSIKAERKEASESKNSDEGTQLQMEVLIKMIKNLFAIDATQKREAYQKVLPMIKEELEKLITMFSKLTSNEINKENSEIIITMLKRQLDVFQFYPSDLMKAEIETNAHLNQILFLINQINVILREKESLKRDIPLPLSLSKSLFERKAELFKAIDTENEKEIREILSSPDFQTLLSLNNDQNENPFSYAVKMRKYRAIKALIEAGQGYDNGFYVKAEPEIQKIIQTTKTARRTLAIQDPLLQGLDCFALLPENNRGKISKEEINKIENEFSEKYHILYPRKLLTPSDSEGFYHYSSGNPVLLLPKSKPLNDYYKKLVRNNIAALKKRITWDILADQTKKLTTQYQKNRKKIAQEGFALEIIDLTQDDDYQFIVHVTGSEFLNENEKENTFSKIGGKEKSVYFSCTLMDKNVGHFHSNDFAVILEVPAEAIVLTSPHDLTSGSGDFEQGKLEYVHRILASTQQYDKQEALNLQKMGTPEVKIRREGLGDSKSAREEAINYLPAPRYKLWLGKEDDTRQWKFRTVEEIRSFSLFNEIIVLGDKMLGPLKSRIRGILIEQRNLDQLLKTKEGREKLQLMNKTGLPIVLVQTKPKAEKVLVDKTTQLHP